MRAALRARDGVHLVEDHRVDRAQQLARLRGQHQEERLRRRDQDVRRVAQHRRALLLRRVARANRNAQLRLQPGERPAQVALDVVVQRLERRDVEDAQAAARRGREPVDRVEERRERLARAGRRLDERVRAARDHRPALLLGRRRRVEGPLEPRARERLKTSSGCIQRSVALSPGRPGRARIEAWPRRTALYFTDDDEACRLLAADPFALLVGFALDQQITVQQAFARAAPDQAARRHARPEDARGAPTSSRSSRRSRRSTASPARWRSACRTSRRVVAEEYGGDAARVWNEAADADDLRRRLGALPGFGEMKVRTVADVLANRFGVERRRRSRSSAHALGGVDSPQALLDYQAAKRAHKAELRAAKARHRAPHAHRRRPAGGGHSARARRLARRGERTLEIAIYDVRLPDPLAAIVADALERRGRAAASPSGSPTTSTTTERVPVPPPPRTEPELHRVAPLPDRGDSRASPT